MPAKKLKVKSGKLKAPVETKQSKAKIRKTTGLTVHVFNAKGRITGKMSLPKEMFGAKVNEKLMAQAVRVYLANQRQGTVSTKTRGEVKGSTRKLYRQKGTGRARAGSIRSPLRVGGGVVFGPKPRDLSLKLSKKMKRSALFSALSSKLKTEEVTIIDGLSKIEPKTKEMAGVLRHLGTPDGRSALLVLPGKLENVVRAARNLEGVDVTLANLLNAYEILAHRRLVFLKEAIETMRKVWQT